MRISALLLLLCAPALAAEPGVVRAGDELRLAVSLPQGTIEFEVYLLVGNDERRVRLTRSRDPRTPVVSIVVPNLPASTARLLVRGGDGEVERDVMRSAPFRIEPALRPTGQAPRRSGAEWWAGDEAPPAAPQALSFAPATRVDALEGEAATAVTTSAPLLPLPLAGRAERSRAGTPCGRANAGPPRPHLASSPPLRC